MGADCIIAITARSRVPAPGGSGEPARVVQLAAYRQRVADAERDRILEAEWVRLKPVLRIDGVAVATGASESPGLVQTLTLEATSPGTGTVSVDHALSVGGVYAFVLDPGVKNALAVSGNSGDLVAPFIQAFPSESTATS